MKKWPIGFLVLVSACASTQTDNGPTQNDKSIGASIREALDRSLSGSPSNTRDSNSQIGSTVRLKLRETELANVIGASQSGVWPRVAVNINTLPKWFYSMPPSGRPGSYSPNDCINVSIKIWYDAKKTKAIDNTNFCGDEIVREMPFSDIGQIWKNFGIVATGNTGTQRTMGPRPPSRLFPNRPGLDMFFQLNGSYFVGSIMAIAGYNWKEPQDARFWIVNVPTQAEIRR